MSQYTKSSSSSSYTALPLTLDEGPSQELSAFDPLTLVQQIWKGFCVPNHDDNSRTNVGDNHSDEPYEQYFRFSGSTASTKDIPRSIDLTSQTMSDNSQNTAAAIVHNKDRQRLESYEFDNIDCKHTTTSSMMIISNDSYDDDYGDDITFKDSVIRRRINCYGNNKEDDDDADDVVVVHDEQQENVTIAPLISGHTNRKTRVTQGFGNFISALLIITLAIYMIQKQQHKASQPYQYHFHVHSKSNPMESSVWRWHWE